MFLLITSYITDLIFGDPEWFPHPVRWMGKLIHSLDVRLGRDRNAARARIKGTLLFFIVVGLSASLSYLFLKLSYRANALLGSLAWIYLAYISLSINDLRLKIKAVVKELKKNSIADARRELSKVVGRDTENLSKDKIITATLETVAESTSDGIVAPIFYLILGGPVLAVAYKAINTLDSMVGYKNEKYINFGWFSAKLDDIANFIPARITGVLIALSSLSINSFRIMLRDGKKHPSPNSGIPEAAMAGALGVKLGGPSTYQGILFNKPYMGSEQSILNPSLIEKALHISFLSSIAMIMIGVFFKWRV